MVGGSMNGKTNDPPGGYSMEVVTLRPPFCFACAYSRNVWQAPRTGDILPGGKVDADIKKSPHASVSEAVGASWVRRRVGYSPATPLLQVSLSSGRPSSGTYCTTSCGLPAASMTGLMWIASPWFEPVLSVQPSKNKHSPSPGIVDDVADSLALEGVFQFAGTDFGEYVHIFILLCG